MSDREATLRQVTAELAEHEHVADAFLAKSFTDRLVIIDVTDSDVIPGELTDRLADHDLRRASEVYGDDDRASFAGDVGDAIRHHFVDVRTRGTQQSYVVEE